MHRSEYIDRGFGSVRDICNLCKDFWIYNTDANDFIKEGNKEIQRTQGRDEKKIKQMFVSPCAGPTKKLEYSEVVTMGTGSSESEVSFAQVLFYLEIGANKDDEEMEVVLYSISKPHPH